MSDQGPSSVGDVIDSAVNDSALYAASAVAASVPEAPDTTVVVEPASTDITATGLDAAAHMRDIAHQVCDEHLLQLLELEEAKKATATPEVVVIQAPPTSAPSTQGTAPPSALPDEGAEEPISPDNAPPLGSSHPYFKPRFGRRRA